MRLLLLLPLLPLARACTMIAVGRNATVDGSTLVAHTDDAGFGAADLRMVRVPAQDHAPGAMRHVYNIQPGYPRVVTTQRGPEYQPKNDQEQFMTPLGEIPQIPHTFGYFDQDYGFMNEVQLSIGESTSGARTAGWPKDAGPHGYNVFGIGELTKVALERCDSARCAIQTMGDLAVKYGFYSEDSGDLAKPDYVSAAETLGIADRYGEVWVFHVLTGPQNTSAVWAAQRVLDTHVVVVANGFVIREMDLDDPDRFMASDNVLSFAEEMDWWDPKQGKFDFSAAYAAPTPDPVRALYMGRRIWRVFDLVAPSLQLDSRLGHYPEFPTYPFSVEPDRNLDVSDVIRLLRDYFQGTPYDLSKGLSAGPFGNPMRWGGDEKGVVGGWERPISMYRTVFSFVLQARAHLPDAVGGVAWYGQSSPHATVYVPFSCAQHEVPPAYVLGKESEFRHDSAWWAFSFVNNWSMLRFDAISKDIRACIAELQKVCFVERKAMEHHIIHTKSITASGALVYLQEQSNRLASRVIEDWWTFAWKLVGKFADGYITTGEAPEEMEMPGYPEWWLKLSEFSKWPGKTLVPPHIPTLQKQFELFESRQNTSVDTAMHQSDSASSSSIVSIAQIGIGAVVGAIMGASGTWFIAVRQRRSGYQPLS
ncbi:Peptidase [Phytophthora megakarya]|uniref:Peptidase n=1 Tax=Phytophthora megakarya TaxID=4795 RepID=A0A225WQN0_9STRA|nr:Peptidase [Phytophthora megakarya]